MRSRCVEIRRCRPLLGTFVEVQASGPGRTKLEAAVERAFAAVVRVERRMSYFDPKSDLSRLHRGAAYGMVEIDPWTDRVLAEAHRLSELSVGAFDVTVAGRLFREGFLPLPEGAPRPDPEATAWDIVRENGRVHFRRPLLIDLGGIAKGFAVDRAIEALGLAGVESAVVNAGGDLRSIGPTPFRVAVRRPDAPAVAAFEVLLSNSALATSGTYFSRRDLDGASPLVRPVHERLVGELVSVSVVAPTCLEADALTKVVLARGPRASECLDVLDAEAVRVSVTRGRLRVRRLGARWKAA